MVAFATFAAALRESRLFIEDLQCILQALNFGLASRFALLVGLWLGDAPLFDFRIVLQNSCEFGVGSVPVCRIFCNLLVKSSGLLRLVLGILLLCCLGNL